MWKSSYFTQADSYFLQTVPRHLRVAWRSLCTVTSVAMHRRAVWLKLTDCSTERSLLLHVRCNSGRFDGQFLFTVRATSYTLDYTVYRVIQEEKSIFWEAISICHCDTKMSYATRV